ncbi:MAG: alpha/beta hydrolase fold domain-containing protein [Gallionella sp.]|nr:alpha/beta hydrolase fold domain-containing protein [Gallionella sp.]
MSGLLPHITLLSGRDPKHSIIWLHGLGANGSDFVPIVDDIHLPYAVRYIFPHAPKRPVTINGGFIMPAWYDVRSDDIGAVQDADGIRESQRAVEALIAQEIASGIAPSHIFLAGFSQGGAVALHCGLRLNERLGGILALSTYLPLADSIQNEAHPAAQATPVFMAHGRSDPIVPYALGKASSERLLALGYDLEWHEYPMPHTVCMEEIEAIERWLKARMQEA